MPSTIIVANVDKVAIVTSNVSNVTLTTGSYVVLPNLDNETHSDAKLAVIAEIISVPLSAVLILSLVLTRFAANVDNNNIVPAKVSNVRLTLVSKLELAILFN